MLLPKKWAQEFAAFSADDKTFADRMTMTGSKVETWKDESAGLHNVVLGRVLTLYRHPDSDHLWVCKVDVGKDEPLQIVTGAQNLKGGELCPVALHGARLPNGQEIKKGKLRGEASEGMLCSLPELNLTVHDFPRATEDGILVLDEDTQGLLPGQNAAAALGLDDTVFEFEITPNRPDCLSVRGLAREAAATFGVPFADRQPAPPAGSGNVAQHLRVKVEAVDICARYAAAVVDNVRIKESPPWLRQRLRQAGVRPINNIVDITNYVMLECGQPMHAFDYAYVNGAAITVRRAREGERIETLDGAVRNLDAEMMVIADEKGPIAVAGIMGGEYSGVYESTRMVVFEAANFDGPSVRGTSKRLGLRTESSSRFEKGIDPDLVGGALARALELVAQLDAGDIVAGVLDDYPAPRQPRHIALRPHAINRLLGIECSEAQMVNILLPLGFEARQEEGEAVITVPTARYDVYRYNDLAEEVARFVGYDKIPMTLLTGAAHARPTPRQSFCQRLCEVLCGYGWWECETFSFYTPRYFDMLRLPQGSPLRSPLRILHPLGEETSVMRTTALPSILEVAARNWAARNEAAALYELATEYLPAPEAGTLPAELQKLILVAYGEGWDYFAVKGAVEGLLANAGIKSWELRRNSEGATWHPGRCAEVWAAAPGEKGEPQPVLLATLGEVHPEVCAAFDIKTRVVAADISVDALFAARGGAPLYQPLPKYPAVTRDLALVMDDEVPAAQVAARIVGAAGRHLENLRLFDVYTGGQLGAGKKSLAYSLVLRGKDATLTDEDADLAVEKILKSLADIGVQLRS